MVVEVVGYTLDLLLGAYTSVTVVVIGHKLVLWLEGLTVLVVMVDSLVRSLEPWMGEEEKVMAVYYLDSRKSRMAMTTICADNHSWYFLVAHRHYHGDEDRVLVWDSEGCSPAQHC
jgi:hypothetical protein